MVNATDFDGSTDYFLRGGGLTGAADGRVGLASVWVRPDAVGASHYIITNTNSRVQLLLNTNKLELQLRNPSNTIVSRVLSATNLSTGSWQHLLVAWDTDAQRLQMYVDDADDADTPTHNSTDDIDYTVADWSVGASTGGLANLNGCISELYFNSAETLDISTTANRRKFVSADLKAVNLGANGSTPTGTAPIVYLPNVFSSFGTNAGTGGNFTDQGSVAACADAPEEAAAAVTISPPNAARLLGQRNTKGRQGSLQRRR